MCCMLFPDKQFVSVVFAFVTPVSLVPASESLFLTAMAPAYCCSLS